MKQVAGFWLPDSEQHLVQFLEMGPTFAGGPTYQLRKLMMAVPYIKDFHHAIDVGAHCGLWTRVLARMFTYVTAFEPVPAHIECFCRNIDASNVELREMALGKSASPEVSLHTGAGSSGDTYVVEKGGEHKAQMQRLDDQKWPMPNRAGKTVDFIKIDCEGFEYFVLKGGERLVKQNRPTIIVEQKPGKGPQFKLPETAACDLLQSWGAGLKAEFSGDYVYAWPS